MLRGGKWRRSGGGSEKEEQEALTLDLTVTSPGEQPSPNPGGIFDTVQIFINRVFLINKSRFLRPIGKNQYCICTGEPHNPLSLYRNICKNICRNIQKFFLRTSEEIFREIYHLQGSLQALAA